jgi:diketogulonate reductase-like aldo/keto reductase
MLEPENLMSDEIVAAKSLQLPDLLYGTAWKEVATQSLVELALSQGFRGIDTANQRRHYHEAAVGQAIAVAIERGHVKRNELFLQTKFTFQRGQDHRLPYDPTAPTRTQVDQSFVSSLEHLRVDYVDSYLLHGPTQRIGLTADDWEAWQAMEVIRDSGRVRALGISNVSLEQLRQLCDGARICPHFVQNRCYAVQGWDHSVRDFCSANGMIYQGFSLLTANRQALALPEMIAIAKHHEKSVPQIVFRFALQVGMLPLTGTKNADHMRTDLDVVSFRLERAEVEMIGRLADR